jgi:hypothetical protein
MNTKVFRINYNPELQRANKFKHTFDGNFVNIQWLHFWAKWSCCIIIGARCSRASNKINHFLPQNNFLLGLNLTARNWWPLAARVKSSRAEHPPAPSHQFPSHLLALQYIPACVISSSRAQSYKSACQRTKCGGDGDMRSLSGSVSKLRAVN